MEWTDLLARWKELGTVGIVILVLAKLGDKAFVWLLDAFGVKIKRAQSREDGLATEVANLRKDVDSMGKRLTRVEVAYEVAAGTAHRCADGIERELKKFPTEFPTILFYVDQLRTVQAIEDVLKN